MSFIAASNSVVSAPKVAETLQDGTTALNADFQTFLKMLTVQAENQDPLNPMDSTEYASQLASFSSVEQQVKTNDLLKALSRQLGTSSLSQLSTWIGMDARSSAPARFGGEPLELSFELKEDVDISELVVKNSAGREVQRLDVKNSLGVWNWEGVSSDGKGLAKGVYQFEVEHYFDGVIVGRSKVETYQSIKEARFENGDISLILDSGAALPSSEISALRR